MLKRTLLVVAILSLLSSAGFCANTAELKPDTVAVFKNGLGFFVRSGTAELDNGWGVTDSVPTALLGTFWMSTSAPRAYVEEIIAYKEDVETTVPAATIADILKANVGKHLTLVRGDDSKLTGKILKVNESRDAPRSGWNPYSPSTSSLVYVRVGVETAIVPIDSISNIRIVGEFNDETTAKEERKRIKFKVNGASKNAPVSMAYLSKGITWTPSYLIDISDPEKASIMMKSTLSNDAEDLEDVDFLFVVGYPNFAFSDVISPIALQQSVNDFITGVRSSRPSSSVAGPLANVMAQSTTPYSGASEVEDFNTYTTVYAEGQSNEDLFLYNKKNVTVKRGERAEFVLFADTVDYEHIYEWNIAAEDQVFHSLRLDNSTDYPWTTAPAFVVNGTNPVAQEKLSYVPKGSKGKLTLTIATDVSVNRNTEEIGRKRISIGNYEYEETTAEGTLVVRSFKSQPIKMVVTRSIPARTIETTDGAKVTKHADTITNLNPTTTLEWVFELAPGEEKKIVYRYKTLRNP